MYLSRTLWQREYVSRHLFSSPQAGSRERYHEEPHTRNLQGSAPSPSGLLLIVRFPSKVSRTLQKYHQLENQVFQVWICQECSYSNHDSIHVDVTYLPFSSFIIWLGLALEVIAEDSIWPEKAAVRRVPFQLGLKHVLHYREQTSDVNFVDWGLYSYSDYQVLTLTVASHFLMGLLMGFHQVVLHTFSRVGNPAGATTLIQ